MEQPVIQKQIKLIAFKAFNVSLRTIVSPSPEECIPKFDLKLADLRFEDNLKCFVKIFHIDLVSPNINELENYREVNIYKIEYHTVFEADGEIDDEFLDSDFAKISAPAIGFPYVRAFISNLSLQAGLPLVILPSINFIQLAHQERASNLHGGVKPTHK